MTPLGSGVLSLFARFNLWVKHHTGELVWAAVFALVVGLPAAVYFAYFVVEPAPYKIYVVAGSHFLTRSPTNLSLDTEQQFLNSFPKKRVADAVDVRLEVVVLRDDDPKTAAAKAQELAAKGDTLLVIGHMDSEPTEASLPVYLGSRPQVPFIASVQTADGLLSKSCKVEPDKRPEDSQCSDGGKALPYLQLSPNNLEQARWAVRYASENHSHRFLIIENDGINPSYAQSLAADYSRAITEQNQAIDEKHRLEKTALSPEEVLTQASVLRQNLSDEILWEQFKESDIDCILYAGGFDGAGPLLKKIVDLKESHLKSAITRKDRDEQGDAERPMMVILDDSVVEERLNGAKFELSPVLITDQADAQDYNSGVSVYGLDAILISSQLIDDMNSRGFNWLFRTKKWLHLLTVEDARKRLVQVMQENHYYHTAYLGGKTGTAGNRSVYAFDGYTRANGFFHVWQRVQSTTGFTNDDIDRWHPRRGIGDRGGNGNESSSEGAIATHFWSPKIAVLKGEEPSAMPSQAAEKQRLRSR